MAFSYFKKYKTKKLLITWSLVRIQYSEPQASINAYFRHFIHTLSFHWQPSILFNNLFHYNFHTALLVHHIFSRHFFRGYGNAKAALADEVFRVDGFIAIALESIPRKAIALFYIVYLFCFIDSLYPFKLFFDLWMCHDKSFVFLNEFNSLNGFLLLDSWLSFFFYSIISIEQNLLFQKSLSSVIISCIVFMIAVF